MDLQLSSATSQQASVIFQIFIVVLIILFVVLFILGIKVMIAIIHMEKDLSRFVDLEYQRWHEQHKEKEEREFIHETAISRFDHGNERGSDGE